MSRRRAHCGHDRTEIAAALEPLVLTVAVLDADRAASLLAGLAEPLRAEALRQLARLEGMGRAERHAALAIAFARSSSEPRGRPASRARSAPRSRDGSPREGPDGGARPGAMERWARRLALELSTTDLYGAGIT